METIPGNQVVVTFNPVEFILTFGVTVANMVTPETAEPYNDWLLAVCQSPQGAKRLMLAMQETVAAYERQYGAIRLPDILMQGAPEGVTQN